jgi:glycosyltransferase involved in cell wall biosynthesis
MIMHGKHLYRTTIPKVSEIPGQPLWSVMIPTYNCAGYLRETLNSVLAQDPGPQVMQIEVVDDHSTIDDPEAVVRELAGDRVSFHRQPNNVGYIQNFDTCLARSRGQWVHLLHGDDLLLPGFYQKMQQGFQQHPDLGAAFCRHIFVDELSNWKGFSELEQPQSGILPNWLEQIAVQQRIQAPSIVVRRAVYEQLGGFDRRMTCWGEDWEMWVRIAAQYPVWYEPQPLALYRQGSTSLTGRSIRSGQNIRDFRQAIGIVRDYLPPERSQQLNHTALRNYANYALDTAASFIKANDRSAAINQIREAFQCKVSARMLYHLLKISFTALRYEIRSVF